MFDITSDEIAQLNDSDLRELVGRLCEAELASLGLSPVAVTWGGNQTAADGGLDVRVSLPRGVGINGFIPRPITGFQVKTPDMPKSDILAEMRPSGTIRPVIQELASDSGGYVIVSSHGSTTDIALTNRRNAMRAALEGVTNADQLQTDFYDRTRLATWVRSHPSLIAWVKARIGQALVGWRPYESWSGSPEGVEDNYLLDDKLRLHLGKHRNQAAQPVADAIDELRDELSQPGKVVRLIGLSGVGKTRFVEALFDSRVGARPLAPSLAFYTNLSDNPNPQPTGLASDLISNRTRGVLIVDNCPPDLHRRLSEVCTALGSTISVLTVEYDVRDDQPEGTQVVILDTSSPELIERLVARRHPHLSQVDARTIAEASGGNSRIAIAIAGTVERSETIAGLSDDELFVRLFQQRHNANDALLRAAQACSLVYSFQGEAIAGNDAELPRLAVLADESPREVYRHVGELLRRDLVQQRGVWRAVLPHAVANRLAARALEDIPYELIDQQLVAGGTGRLARSFSRRLSFLHEHSHAVDIVERWLAPGGLLGTVADFNELDQAMFENVAPVSPEATLVALERAGNGCPDVAAQTWRRHHSLLRSLAYDPDLFERSASALALAATCCTDEKEAKEASDTFASLFTIYLSGTHATIELRLGLIEKLLRSGEPRKRSLGIAALEKVLVTGNFSSSYGFEFGAWSRNYGYTPSTLEEMARWYAAALEMINRIVLTEGLLKLELRSLVAQHFRMLWTDGHVCDELEDLSRRFTADEFWREGWAACRETMHFDEESLTPQSASRLSALEIQLRPSNLAEQVRGIVLSNVPEGLDHIGLEPDGNITNEYERHEAISRELAANVASDETVLVQLLPDLLRGGGKTWSFGGGLAAASIDPSTTWTRLMDGAGQTPAEQRNLSVLRGYLAELWIRNRELAQELLDAALNQPTSAEFFPMLQSAVQLDERGANRLKQALRAGQAPLWMYRNLALGRVTDQLSGRDLQDLLMHIIEQPDGFEVAADILSMRFHSDLSDARELRPDLLEAGRELLRHVSFKRRNRDLAYKLARIARPCMEGSAGAPVAAEVAKRLRRSIAANETNTIDTDELLRALFRTQPLMVLDALFDAGEGELRASTWRFDSYDHRRPNALKEVSCEVLVAWCNGDAETRYSLMASFIPFKNRAEENGPQIWSEQAKALLASAPNPRNVLAVFIQRFRPMAWSGSRATHMEENARLLDDRDVIPAILIPFAAEAKDQLEREIAHVRQSETERDQVSDERFE